MIDSKLTLATLPDDVLLLIVGHIETGQGMANLSYVNRRLHHLVRSDGWSIFARGCFPSLALPPVSPSPPPPGSNGAQQPLGWDKLCDSLTWQSRAWDRRSIVLRALVPHHNRLTRPQAAPFHPTIAAHHDLSGGEELVAWGAGQDIVGRWRRRKSRFNKGVLDGYDVNVKWARLSGSSIDYGPGRDDVTAISLVKTPLAGAGGESLAILAGRENGHLALLSAKMDSQGEFGQVISTFRPEHGITEPRTTRRVLTSTSRICSTDLSRDGKTVAVATQSSLRLYSMPQEATDEVRPVDVYRLQQEDDHDIQGITSKAGVFHKAKWMPGGDVLALSVTEHPAPIQCLKITPSGMEVTAAAKNHRLEAQSQLSHRICPNSIEPLPPSSTTGGNGNLLLSAWRDGTVRLQDLRTPSPWDVVYQDNVDPWSRFESLLPIGTDRFVAGGLDGSVVKIFDFRLPRTYHYSAALPCSGHRPMPPPSQPFMAPLQLSAQSVVCDHMAPETGGCTFHRLARNLFYRPNCSLFFHATRAQPAGTHARDSHRGGFSQNSRRTFPNDPGVWSLARGADTSPHFYIGVAGGIIEASLKDLNGRGDPNFDMRSLDWTVDGKAVAAGSFKQQHGMGNNWRSSPPMDAASEAQYSDQSIDYSIMETGDGLRYIENERAIRLPPMIKRTTAGHGGGGVCERFQGHEGRALRDVWRLDEAFEA